MKFRTVSRSRNPLRIDAPPVCDAVAIIARRTFLPVRSRLPKSITAFVPLALPGLLSAVMIAFAMCISSFVVPLIAGCTAPDGSYWVVQKWQRMLPTYL